MNSDNDFHKLPFIYYILFGLFIFIAICCTFLVFDIDINKLPLNQLLMKTFFINVNAAPSSSTPSQPEPEVESESDSLSMATSNTLSGAYTIYLQTTSNSQLPTSYNNMINGISFPHSTYQLFGPANYNSGAYIVGTMIQLYTESNYIKGNDYTLQLHFDMGSYLWPFWPNSSTTDWDFNGCPGAACEMNYQWLHDSSLNTLDITIKFRATSNSSAALFTFGRLDNNKGVFYNSYTQNQGIRLSSASITSTGSGNSDLSTVESGISDINDNLDDINNNISDSSIDNGLGSQFLNLFSHNDHALASIVTAPLNFLNSLDDPCQPITIPFKLGGGNGCGGLPVCVNDTYSKNATIQCGDTLFWNKSEVSVFRVFWNALFGGAIIYMLGFKLFKTINRALDPFVDDINGLEV